MINFPKTIDDKIEDPVVLPRKKYDELLRKASYDEDTDLLKKARFEDLYRHDLDVARRSVQNGASSNNMSLLYFDINELKYVNDTYGHEVGTDLLIEFADLLKIYFRRESDVKARIGGDEFAVLLPQTDFESARQKSKKLRKVALRLGISVSVGVANYSMSVEDPVVDGRYVRSFYEVARELKEKADANLYHNKDQMHRLINHKKFYDRRFKDSEQQVAA